MRALRLVLLLLLLAAPAGAQGRGELIVPGRGAGPILLGGTPEVLVPRWGAPRRRLAEDKTSDPRAPKHYYEYPEHGVWMLVQGGRIRKIGLESGPWCTREGLKLWATVDQVTRAWGRGRTRWPEGTDPSKRELVPRYFLSYPSRGVDFLILQKSRLVEAIHLYPPVR